MTLNEFTFLLIPVLGDHGKAYLFIGEIYNKIYNQAVEDCQNVSENYSSFGYDIAQELNSLKK